MSSTTSSAIVIDARPRGPRGPLAGEKVLGRPVLAHLVELADSIAVGPVAVHARIDEHKRLNALIPDSSVVFALGPPPENATILRTDRLYDARRLKRAIRSGRDVESAVLWRLDQPSALAAADEELLRRTSYQPLGRYWALAPAQAIARSLVSTPVRPNVVTVASAAMMIGSSLLVALAPMTIFVRLAVASGLALALILDTADGHLARLQGTASEFGRWLDAMLDELADLALHAAIGWSAFASGGGSKWLLLGILYIAGKYLFVIAQQEDRSVTEDHLSSTKSIEQPSTIVRAVRLVGHADIRWHLWIILAACGHLELALILFAGYFPARTLAIAAKKAVRHG